MDLANRGAATVLELLSELDSFGVIAVDTEPIVVVPFATVMNNMQHMKNKIYSNVVYGFHISKSNNNIIKRNEIKDNFKGLMLTDSNSNIIKNNNFIGNNRNVKFLDIKNNQWNRNYWGRSRLLPKIILGSITIQPPGFHTPGQYFPWLNFDWHPAIIPHDFD